MTFLRVKTTRNQHIRIMRFYLSFRNSWNTELYRTVNWMEYRIPKYREYWAVGNTELWGEEWWSVQNTVTEHTQLSGIPNCTEYWNVWNTNECRILWCTWILECIANWNVWNSEYSGVQNNKMYRILPHTEHGTVCNTGVWLWSM